MATLAQALEPLVAPATRARHAASCAGKAPFLTAAEAQAVLDVWWGDAVDPTCGVYRCTNCWWYHLGRYAGVAEEHERAGTRPSPEERTMDVSAQGESPAIQFLSVLWKHSLKATGPSWTRLNAGMRQALHVAIRTGLPFALEDFERLSARFRFRYWCGKDTEKNAGEQFYTTACQCGNRSACRSFEHHAGRKPFMVHGQRLHLRADVRWEGVDTLVTSFDDEAGTLTLCAYARVSHFQTEHGPYAHGDGKPTRMFTVTHEELRAAFPTKRTAKPVAED
jgi:hypothetical protein